MVTLFRLISSIVMDTVAAFKVPNRAHEQADAWDNLPNAALLIWIKRQTECLVYGCFHQVTICREDDPQPVDTKPPGPQRFLPAASLDKLGFNFIQHLQHLLLRHLCLSCCCVVWNYRHRCTNKAGEPGEQKGESAAPRHISRGWTRHQAGVVRMFA